MNEPIPRRRRHPHHVCIDCGFEWDGITAAPVAGEGLDVERLVEAERAMRKRLRTLAPESCLWMDGVVEHAAGLAYEYDRLAANLPVAEERT